METISVSEGAGTYPIWMTYNLDKDGDTFLCQKVLRNRDFPTIAKRHTHIANNVNEVIDFFGLNGLARRLYKNAGIDQKMIVKFLKESGDI